jgi:hypothetical protein
MTARADLDSVRMHPAFGGNLTTLNAALGWSQPRSQGGLLSYLRTRGICTGNHFSTNSPSQPSIFRTPSALPNSE